jgi:D-inositol-3-phosphate glycosyltransferase
MAIKSIAMICVHTSPLAPLGADKAGGMNVYVRELGQELGARGIQVDIFTRYAQPDTPQVDTTLGKGVRVISVEAGPRHTIQPNDVFEYLEQFATQVMAFATNISRLYDLIYSHYWLSGIVAQRLKETWQIPFVQMFHTLGQMKHRITANLPSSSTAPDTRVSYENKVVDWADYLIAATRAEYTQLLWLYRADRRKIEIIPPGYDPRVFYPIQREIARQAIAQAGVPYIFVFVGRLEPLKAIDSIMEAVAFIAQSQDDLFRSLLLIVVGGDVRGHDPELNRLRQVTQTLKIADQVQFIGSQEHTRLRELYAAATAVLMPSDYESFGMVALEAMAAGAPVIASEVGGLAYLVKNEETGFLVPSREPVELASRMMEIMENPALQDRMSKAAALAAARYTWDHIADQLETVFENAIAAGALNPRRSSEYP